LVFILILLTLVVVITVMQSFESPALISSFKGLLTVMSFVQSFVSLRVRMFWNQNMCHAALVIHGSQFLDINWPPIMQELFALFKPLTFSLDIVRPECSVDLSPEQKLYAVLFVPVCCCIGVALMNCFFVMISIYRLSQKIRKTVPSSMQMHVSGGFRVMCDCLIASSFGRKMRRETISDFGHFYYALNPLLFIRADWNIGTVSSRNRRSAASFSSFSVNKNGPNHISKNDTVFPEAWVKLRNFFVDAEFEAIFMRNVLTLKKSASGALSVLILSFVGVMETALPILSCFPQVAQDGTEKQYLRSDRSIECSLDNSVYRSLASMAILGIFLYALVVPLIMHVVFRSKWCLRFYRLDYSSHNNVFGFVTSRYRRDYLSWELINHLKKGSQIAIPLYLASAPVQQSVSLFFLNCIFSVCVLYTMPFSSTYLNVMEILSSLDLLVTVIVGIFFVVEFEGEPVMSETAKQFFGVLLVALCAATLAASVFCIFQEVAFLARLHKQPSISAWLRVFSGNAGDSVADKSLFSLYFPSIFNKISSKAIVDFNSSIENSPTSVWAWLKSRYSLLTYQPASSAVMPFLGEPLSEILKDMHQLIRRIGELRKVGIYCPEDKLDSFFLETFGNGDPPYEVYKQIAIIDDALKSSLSLECNRYLLAILVAEKFRKKHRENVFTQTYWNRIVPSSQALLRAISKVQPASQKLMTLKPESKGVFGFLSERLWPDYSVLFPRLSAIKSFNELSSAEHADFVKVASSFSDDDYCSSSGSTCDDVKNHGVDHGHRLHDKHDHDGSDSEDGDANLKKSEVSRYQTNPSKLPSNADPDGQLRSGIFSGARLQFRDNSRRSSLVASSDYSVQRKNQLQPASKKDELVRSRSRIISREVEFSELHVSEQQLPSPHTKAGLSVSAPAPPRARKSVANPTDHGHSPPPMPRVSDPALVVQDSAAANVVPLNDDLARHPKHAERSVQSDTKAGLSVSAPAPPRARKSVANPTDHGHSPPPMPRVSDPALVVQDSAAANVVPLNDDLARHPKHAERSVQSDTKAGLSVSAPAPPRAPNVFVSPTLQRTNALNQPLASSSKRETNHADKRAGARPRHVVLASAAELEAAIAVEIPAGNDHKRAEFLFDWPTPAAPLSAAPKLGADKLKAILSAKSALSAHRKA
jgi:hypothetical protein